MRQIDLIVIHCSASKNGQSLFTGVPGTPSFLRPVETIDGWHQTRGFQRGDSARLAFNPNLKAIGYHHVVYLNGAVATGRAHDEIGAHVQGYNQKSLGVCLVGTDKFTGLQWGALRDLVSGLKQGNPNAVVRGHRDLSPDVNHDGVVEPQEWLKICPGFDVAAWLKGDMAPLADHLLEA